jgi:hypothetical protein
VRRDVPDRSLRGPGARAGAAGLGLAALIVGLAACGGGNGETTSTSVSKGDALGQSNSSAAVRRERDHVHPQLKSAGSSADLIRLEVKGLLTSSSPAVCSSGVVTKRYLEKSYGGHQGCVRAQKPGSVADHVDFKELRIEGDRATAVVVPSGGLYDGERISVLLVRDPRWAVDELHSNVPVGP